MKEMNEDERTFVTLLNIGLVDRRIKDAQTEIDAISAQIARVKSIDSSIFEKLESRKIFSTEEWDLANKICDLAVQLKTNQKKLKFEENTKSELDQILLEKSGNFFINLLHDVGSDPSLIESKEKRILITGGRNRYIVTIKKSTNAICKELINKFSVRRFFEDSGLCVKVQVLKKGELKGKDKNLFKLSCELKRPIVCLHCICGRDFYTINKNQKYCTSKCKNDQSDKRRNLKSLNNIDKN